MAVNLLELISNHMKTERQQRYRDRRAHYASSGLKNLRDQYWEMTGEPKTNPTDLWGRLKMLVGNAVELGIVTHILNDLHWYGLHMLGTQVQVGGSNPNWDGSLDALVAIKGDEGYSKFVIEIKTKSGYGADLLLQSMEPAKEYMAQLGLYLRDLSHKGVTNEGCLLYVLLSDRNFGHFVQMDAHYEKETDEVVFTKGRSTTGRQVSLNHRLCLKEIDARWIALEKHLKDKTLPPEEHKYKFPLTSELLESLSDAQLKACIEGKKCQGDWQVQYSSYKEKHLQESGDVLGYTEDELGILRAEYRRRHPKSKI